MQLLRRKTAPPPTLPIHNGPSRVISYLDWMTTATSAIWAEQDEWKRKQYKMVKYSASEHNKSLVEVLKERNGNDFDEISPFMNQHPSNRGEQETQRVEAFCEGVDMVLHGSDPTLIQGHKLANVEEPRAWVSDRNYWLLKDDPTKTSRHRNVLGRIDLYNILRKERFRESASGEMVGPIRQIFVSNPDGASVLAILKTANEFQVTALHDLLASYITTDPSPSISLKVSDFWNTSYVISFTLPFYAIGRRGKRDKRTLHDDKLRACHDLESLNLEGESPIPIDTVGLPLKKRLVLHEGVYSFSATGVTEEHWTAYCFDDDFFESESRLLEDEEEIESSEGGIDPIIVEAEMKDTATQWRPRQYSLVALATQLEKVHGHHECAHDVFKRSLASYTRNGRNGPNRNHNHSNDQDWKRFPDLLSKVIFYTMENVKEVESFLKNDVQLSQASLPQGVLWQSLRNDKKALKALRAITENVKKLKRLGDKMEETKKSYKELRRERKLDRADEQQSREERTKEFTIAAVVFAILSLIAQVYSGKPQKGDEASWPGYLFLVASFLIICIAGILYMLRDHLRCIPGVLYTLWKHISNYGKMFVLKVKMVLKTNSLALRNSLRAVSLEKCAYYVCFYLGLVFLFRILKKRLRRDETVLPI